MAIWQFKVGLIPNDWICKGGAVESLWTPEGFDTSSTWSNFDSSKLIPLLDKILPRSDSQLEDVFFWGTETRNDMCLFFENDKVIDLVIRFDMNRPQPRFFEKIAELAREQELACIDLALKRQIPTKSFSIMQAAMKSNAARYVFDS